MTPQYESAIRCLADGLKVFPLAPRSKVPATEHGYKDATDDIDLVNDWWRANPEYNVGLMIPDGVAVLDADDAEMAQFVENLFGQPFSRTPRGTHTPVQCGGYGSRKIGVLPHLDWLVSGYIVGPGSIHPDGGLYECVTRWPEPDRLPKPPKLMLSLLELKTKPIVVPDSNQNDAVTSRYVARALVDEVERIRHAPAHERNNTLNEATFALAQLVGAGVLSRSLVYETCRSAGLEVGLRRGEVEATIESALNAGIAQPRDLSALVRPGRKATKVVSKSKTIVTGGRTVIDAAAQPGDQQERAIAALKNSANVYSLSGRLARVVSDGRRRRIEVLDAPMLANELLAVAAFVDFDHAGNPKRELEPSAAILKRILAWGGIAETFRPIERIVTAPFFTPDGALVAKDGYDAGGRCYVELDGLVVPETRLTIPEAIALIDELLWDFPFVAPADKTNTIALMLLPLVRPLIAGPTPLHDITSPTPGSGKGKLAEAAMIAASGTGIAKLPPAESDAEMRKRITADLLAGTSVIVLDNIAGRFVSPSFASAITANYWRDRELGKNLNHELPNRATWIMTGNNVVMSGENARRTVVIRLDANLQKPWERTGWRHHPLERWALEHRGPLVGALIALVQAWLDAGRPGCDLEFGAFGSFEAYADVIGGILANAGIAGFLDNRTDAFAEIEAESEELAGLVKAWHDSFGDDPVLARRLYDTPRIWEQLDPEARRSGVAFGYFLRGHKNRIVCGYKITNAGMDTSSKATLWRLERVEPTIELPEGLTEKDRSPSGDGIDLRGIAGGISAA